MAVLIRKPLVILCRCRSTCCLPFCVLVLVLALSVAVAVAAEPEIRNLDLRGLTIGSTTTVVIDGANLSSESRLVLPFPATQEIQPGATANRVSFRVTPAGDVTSGIYAVRIVNADGISAPVIIAVDALPQQAVSSEVKSLPVALHGTVGGSAVVEARIPGRAGDDITIDVEAQRLGGKLRPVVHLLDPNRRQIGWSWSSPRWHGDARLIAKLPVDGTYTITLHDTEYAAPAPNHFRLKIGRWEYVDQVFPRVIARGQPLDVTLIGTKSTSIGSPQVNDGDHVLPLPWPDPAQASGLRPWVALSSLRELIEQPKTEVPHDLGALPVAISGRIAAPNETDRFRLTVTPGQKIRFEITAERDGSPLDAVLVLTNEQGAQLARGDDGPGTCDPVLDFTVPANLTALIVSVGDLHTRGDALAAYRLVVTDGTTSSSPVPRLLLQNDRVSLMPGSRQVIPVLAESGSELVRLTVDGLPTGVTAEGLEIAPNSDGTLLTIAAAKSPPAETPSATAADGANENAAATPPQPAASEVRPAAQVATLQIRGNLADGRAVPRATVDDHPLARLQPWLAADFALSVAAPMRAASPAQFEIDWGTLPADLSLVLAGKLTLPIKVTRPPGDATAIRLSLLTNQNVPQLNGRPDPNKAVRAEAPVEIPADKLEGQVVALVPADLPRDVYDVTVKAELLNANKQAVLATAFTPVKRFNLVNPIGLMLAAGLKYESAIDPKTGANVKLTGQVERRAAMAGPITLSLSGLPAGVRADSILVKPEDTAFELNVQFPPNFQPSELTGLQLVANGPPDPKLPAVVVRSKPLTVTIVIAKPAEGTN